MSLKTWLNEFILRKKADIERGRSLTLQMEAERQRVKQDKLKHMAPGARKTITQGLMTRSSPMDVMREEYNRRKYEREHNP